VRRRRLLAFEERRTFHFADKGEAMATNHLRSSLVVVTVLISVMCVDLAEAGGGGRRRALPVALIAPAANAVIVQNDPALATICTNAGQNATSGYGFRVTFDWSAYRPAKKVAFYTVELRHGSSSPISLDTAGQETTLDYIACNNFVIDTNLSNWTWNVIVQGTGKLVQDPEHRPIHFGACRLPDNSVCNAPAP